MDRLDPDLAAWIGRQHERTDTISPRLAESFAVTLAPYLAGREGAPLGLHWCLAPDLVGPAETGADGHPRGGIVLPPLPYSRRMWAGGELVPYEDFAVGEHVARTTVVRDVAFKTGKTGRLAFVTIQHDYRVGERLMLSERQDVVYRDAAGTGSRPHDPPKAELAAPPLRSLTLATDPVLLFRYSALTFNSHRIHYDRPYATDAEGYAGLVVHGPLQATVLLNLAAAAIGAVPRRFAYRGQAPLLCGVPARAEFLPADPAAMDPVYGLRLVDASDTVTMVAWAWPPLRR